MNQEFILALNQLQEEKNINKDELIEAIETSIASAYQKNYSDAKVEVKIDRDSGEITVFETKKVVDDVINPNIEISLEDAQKIDPSYELSDVCRIAITPKDFGRIAAQNAKQLIIHQIKEAERNLIYEEYKDRVGEVLNGTITRIDNGNVYVNLGPIEAFLPVAEQISGEEYERGQRIKVLLTNIRNTPRGTQIRVSRRRPDFIKRLFEAEVPEIYDGSIDIYHIAREPGIRTKIAVLSHINNLDAVGSCIGQRGSRIQNILSEVNNERIDVIEYSDDIIKFLTNALSPATVKEIIINDDKKSAVVVVDDSQLALAIGREGKNVQLASKLTGWKVDIKSETQFADILKENPDFISEFKKSSVKDKNLETLEEILSEEFFDDEPKETEEDQLFNSENIKELFEEE